MRRADTLRLVALGAIWGFSFIFMRVIVPVYGPALTAHIRLTLSGLVFFAYFRFTGLPLEWKKYWRHYFFIGFLNSAFPFTLFAFAANHIPAAYSAVLNSTAPFFGAICSAIWLNEKLTIRKLTGLVSGAIGVSLVTRPPETLADPLFGISIAGCLVAACCYALSGIYIRRFCSAAKPMAVATATQLTAGFILFPALFFFPDPALITLPIFGYTLGLALLCSGLAYVLYFRLLADLGPTKALTVTFLVPVFGILWGFIFLGERLTPLMLAGTALIILGTFLVVRAKPQPRRYSST